MAFRGIIIQIILWTCYISASCIYRTIPKRQRWWTNMNHVFSFKILAYGMGGGSSGMSSSSLVGGISSNLSNPSSSIVKTAMQTATPTGTLPPGATSILGGLGSYYPPSIATLLAQSKSALFSLFPFDGYVNYLHSKLLSVAGRMWHYLLQNVIILIPIIFWFTYYWLQCTCHSMLNIQQDVWTMLCG